MCGQAQRDPGLGNGDVVPARIQVGSLWPNGEATASEPVAQVLAARSVAAQTWRRWVLGCTTAPQHMACDTGRRRVVQGVQLDGLVLMPEL
jgi:hypothetical protein